MVGGDRETDELLVRVRNGDEHTFRVLIEPHRVALFRHCYRMLGSGPTGKTRCKTRS